MAPSPVSQPLIIALRYFFTILAGALVVVASVNGQDRSLASDHPIPIRNKAQLIVVAEATSKTNEALPADHPTGVQTVIDLSVLDVIKGEFDNPTIHVRYFGGKLPSGDLVSMPGGTPELVVDAQYLLFLQFAADGYWAVVGGNLGVWRIVQDPRTGQNILINSDNLVLKEWSDIEWHLTAHPHFSEYPPPRGRDQPPNKRHIPADVRERLERLPPPASAEAVITALRSSVLQAKDRQEKK